MGLEKNDIMWFRLPMADLVVVGYSYRTADAGRLFHCMISRGEGGEYVGYRRLFIKGN